MIQNKLPFKLMSGLFAFLLLGMPVGLADEADSIAELKKENKELRSMVGDLQKKMEMIEGHMAKGVPVMPMPEEGDGIVRGAGGDIRISGFVDTSFNWNFQDPTGAVTAAGARTSSNSTIRAFDRSANTFDLNNFQLEISRPAPESDKVSAGFMTQLTYGSDAQVIESAGFLGGTDELSIQEAFAEIKVPNIPMTSGITVWAGKFATLLGAEVIENHMNWNASRSILFNNAIPFTHTGVRAMTTVMDGKVSLATGLVNGWDQAVDVNDVKDWEARVGWTPNENFTTSAGFMIGSQTFEDSASQRGILDLVAMWTPLPADLPGLKLMANYDYGWEEDLGATIATAAAEGGKADWQGYALYARYEINDKLAVGYRFEQFWDDQGVRTASTATDLRENTISADYKLTDKLLLRGEYRYDSAEGGTAAFDSATSKHQSTALASLIYMFA